jgi:hypothetical protein
MITSNGEHLARVARRPMCCEYNEIASKSVVKCY